MVRPEQKSRSNLLSFAKTAHANAASMSPVHTSLNFDQYEVQRGYRVRAIARTEEKGNQVFGDKLARGLQVWPIRARSACECNYCGFSSPALLSLWTTEAKRAVYAAWYGSFDAQSNFKMHIIVWWVLL